MMIKSKADISGYEKVCHWLILIAFLGLCITALAADFFFSKEAILESFKNSLPIINLEISPADQLFIARLERRNTWDVHLYFGLAMLCITIVWLVINIVRSNYKHMIFKSILFVLIIDLSISGIWMWRRLYFALSDENFKLLKQFHHFAYWFLIGIIIIHVIGVIIKENMYKGDNLLSNMLKFKNYVLVALLLSVITPNLIKADEDLNNWTSDENYIEGVLYLEGAKGYETILKEITNCPYDKCKAADIKNGFGTKTLELRKPDYKKAIEQLSISSTKGNALASNKLIQFLIKRVDYKAQVPDEYLVKQLNEETGLDNNQYKKIVNKTIQEGVKTNKSCISEYYYGELLEYGLLDNKKDFNTSQEHYKKAEQICPEKNLFKMLATTKIKK